MLNNLSQIKKIDQSNMSEYIAALPLAIRKAEIESQKLQIPDDYKKINKVIICGMGGSAIGGDIAADLLPQQLKMPITVNRHYHLPAYADEKTLIICISYSGDTVETLTSFQDGLDQKAKIIAITGGGELEKKARENNIPLFKIQYKSHPRAALAYTMVPIIVILQKLNILDDKESDLSIGIRTISNLNEELNPSVKTEKNLAKHLAYTAMDRLPIVIGSGILEGVARRWKTQLNENAKTIGFVELIPELDHNMVEGFNFPHRIKDDIIVFILRNSLEHTHNIKRFQILQDLLNKKKIYYENLEARGPDIWSQKFSMIMLGDYVSYYLAILNKVDPTPVEVIQWMKGELA